MVSGSAGPMTVFFCLKTLASLCLTHVFLQSLLCVSGPDRIYCVFKCHRPFLRAELYLLRSNSLYSHLSVYYGPPIGRSASRHIPCAGRRTRPSNPQRVTLLTELFRLVIQDNLLDYLITMVQLQTLCRVELDEEIIRIVRVCKGVVKAVP
jgi:hypothetical protein